MNINFAIQDEKKVDIVYLYVDTDVEDTQRCLQVGVHQFIVQRAHGKYLSCKQLYGQKGIPALHQPGGIMYNTNTYRTAHII